MEIIKQTLLIYINQILNDCTKNWDFNKNTCVLNYNNEAIIISKVKDWVDIKLNKMGTDWLITLKNSHNEIQLSYSCWEVDDLITSLGGKATTEIL